jgi:hypothetical protein
MKRFALCLDNEGNEASLMVGKVYPIIPDARTAKDALDRVVDESGDAYLFLRNQLAFVDFPEVFAGSLERCKVLANRNRSVLCVSWWWT